MANTEEAAQGTDEELILNKKRRRIAKLVDALLWCGYQIHSTITLRRFKKRRPLKKVLVYASMMLGETFIGMESLESIKRKYPDTTFVINPAVKGLFKDHKTIEYTPPWFSYGEKMDLKKINGFFGFTRSLKKQKFDAAIDLRGDMRNNLILYLTGAPTRIGYGNTGGRYFLTDPVPLKEELEVRRNNDIAKAAGASPKEFTFLKIPKKDYDAANALLKERLKKSRKYIAIIPSAGYWTKVWPKERWTQVIERLDKEKITAILLGAPNEREYTSIAKESKSEVIDLIGQLTLMQSGAVMKEVSLVIGSDNGAMHLAAAVGADTLTLFGPTLPSRWRPEGKGKGEVITKKQYCSPCGRLNECPINKECMTKITVDDVVEKIKELVR